MKRGKPIYCPPFIPMADVLPECEKDGWSVKHVEMDEEFVKFEQLRGAFGGGASYREVWDLEPGKYARLFGPGYLHDPMMSDTPMERRTCRPLLDNARGSVFIAGLGIGMVLLPLLRMPEVRSITVMEINQVVVDLIWPFMLRQRGARRLSLVVGNVLEYRPSESYDTVWLDIWGDICADNWEQMKKLRRCWKSHVLAGGWLGVWRYEDVRISAAEDRHWGRAMGLV